MIAKFVVIEKDGLFHLYRKISFSALSKEIVESLSDIAGIFILPIALIYVAILRVVSPRLYVEETYHLVCKFNTLEEAIEYKTKTEDQETEKPQVYYL